MSDIESNINLNINGTEALATIKALQSEISRFHAELAKQGAASAALSSKMQQDLTSSINASGKFSAQMRTIQTTTEAFTTSLEKNKLGMGEYFRYAMASTRTFGNSFKGELETIDKVARERVKDLQTQYIKMGRDANGAMKAIAVRPLALDLEDFGTKTQIAAQKHQLFNQLLSQGSTNLLNWGKNTQWAGRQLMVGFSLPLATFAAVAGTSFMKLEKAAISFRRVYGDAMTPASETAAMTKQIQELATSFTQYGVAVSDTMTMAAQAAAQGATGNALLAQVTQTNKLAVLGNIDQQKSLETITSLTTTFGIATKDLANNIDFLNAVENQTVLSIDDMTTAIPIAAPVVQSLGGDVRDLSVMLTAMKEGGINASEGANALKSGLAALINPTDAAKESLGAMGVDLDYILNTNRGNAIGMIQTLSSQLDKLDPTSRAQAIEQLFGKFQFARMSTLLQNINKEGTQAAKALELTKKSAGDLAAISQKELSSIAESPAFKFQKAIADFQAAVAPVGESFIKIATPLINIGTEILKWFNSLSDGAKNWTVAIVAGLGLVAPVVLMVTGLIANGAANITKFILMLGNMFSKTKGSAQILGETTSYMTKAQLDNAAVAASLDQVHMQLTQRFTSQKEAIDMLIASYQRMVALQRDTRSLPIGSTIAAGAGVKAKNERWSYSGPEKNLEEHTLKNYGEMGGQVALDRSYDQQKAEVAFLKKLQKEKPGSVTTQQINAAMTELNRSHVVEIPAGMPKKDESVWQGKTWSVDTPIQNNTVLESIRKSSKNQAALKLYLEKIGAAEDQVTRIMGNVSKGIMVAEEDLATYGKALDAIHKDWKSGKIVGSNTKKDAMISETLGPYAGAAGAGIRRRTKFNEGLTQEELAASTVSETERKKEQSTLNARAKALGLSLEENKKVTDSDTAATKTKTAKTKASTTAVAQNIVATEEDTTSKRSRFSGKATRIAGAAGAALGSVSMIAGGLGLDNMLGSLAGPITAVSTALMMIPGPAGIVVAALAGLVSGFMAYSAMMDNARKSGEELAASMSLTKEKLTGISDLTGQTAASTTAQANRDAAVASIKTGMSQEAVGAVEAFQKSFKESEVGKSFLEDIQKQLKNGSSMKDVAQNMSTQLATAIAEGTLSKSQADAIAESLGESIKNKQFAIQLKGQLISLVGPNGENLETNPGAVANTITERANKQAADAAAVAQRRNAVEANAAPKAIEGAGMGAVAGTLGAFALSMFWNPVGWATAAVVGIGTIVGAVVGLANAQAEATKNAAMATDLYSQAYKQNLDMTDAIKSQYGTLIANKQALLETTTNAEERKKIEEDIKILQEGQTTALERQKKASSDLVGSAKDAVFGKETTQYTAYGQAYKTRQGGMGEDAWNSANKDALKEKYKNDALSQSLATTAYDKASKMKDETAKMTVELQITSGELDPATAATLMDSFAGKKGEKFEKTYTALIEQQGDQAVIDSVSALTAAGANGTTIQAQLDLVYNSDDPKKAMADLNALMGLAAKMTSMGITIDVNTEEGMKRLNEVQATLTKADELFASTSPITAELLMQTTGIEMTQSAMDYYNSLDPSAQKTYTTAYLTVYEKLDLNNADDRARMREWAETSGGGKAKYADKGNKIKGAAYDYAAIAKDWQAWADNQARNAVVTSQSGSGTIPPPPGPQNTGGGGGSTAAAAPEKDPTSFIDSLIKSIRDLRLAGVSLTDTFATSWAAINGMFGNGASLNMFGGLEQQMRQLGAGQDLIDLITGMSAEEYAQRKNDLFNFDAAGNITGFKDMLASIARAMNAINLGTFQNKQQQAITLANDQTLAIRRLVAAGMSYAEAFNAASDAATAYAIAGTNDANVINQIATAANAAAKATANMSAAQSLSQTNQSTADMGTVLGFMQKYSGALTDAQKNLILTDKNVQDLVRSFDTLTPEQLATLDTALKNADLKVGVDLEINKQTIDGMEKIFSDGFSKAMEQFSAKETKINLDFQIAEAPYQKLITTFQNQIEDIRTSPGGINDLQADLQRISDQEKDINDKYKDRFAALDKIEAANQRIAALQRSQLSIADALTQGDIASAARATEEMRAQDQQAAMTDQRKLLTDAQTLELEALRGQLGLSRKQIEEQIRDLNMDILNIQNNQIDPAQRQVDLLERSKQVQLDSLTVMGMTKDEWNAIKNNIDLAKTNSISYAYAIQGALDTVMNITSYWDDLDGKKVSTIHEIIEVTTKTNTPPPPAPAPAPTPAPIPAPAPTIVKDQAWIDNMARAVIRGDYGNGQARKDLLGSDYDVIQDRVNAHYYRGQRLFAAGGMVTNYLAAGGFAKKMFAPVGTDTVPAMLTPGEFVVKKFAVDQFGANNLHAINNGTYDGGSVYNSNYSINVNVRSDANPEEIARTVIRHIKGVDAQRIRGNKL